jgi:hypothetical protein
MRRPARISATISCAALLLTLTSCATSGGSVPDCGDPANRLIVLVAQSVPSATLVPCVSSMPVGWSYGGSEVQNNVTRMWLSSTVAGIHAVELELTPACDPGSAPEVVPAPDEAGAHVYDAPTSLNPFQGTRFVVFPGGCVRYDYRFMSGVPATLSLQADDAFSFVPRARVVQAVRDEFDQVLCGAGAPPCEGDR